MDYEIVVGLEVHAQLLTQSKMFCGCSADYAGAPPNTHVCPVCLGMPGVLPVINAKAVEYTIMTALALNCQIPPFSRFDRKNYHYPDLVKGYQISQYDLPLSHDGWLEVEVDGQSKRIGITRVHLEEDTGKLLHVGGAAGEQAYSLIDFNRSGVPLMEIVSEPDMHSLDEVRQYVNKIRTVLRYLGVSSGDMEKGAMRFEANVSLRPVGETRLGNRVEVKNLNSFRAVLRSLEFEVARQRQVLAGGGRIDQETMGWDEARNVTVPQRSKEEAQDYRYFPEPDLPPLVSDPAWVESIRAKLPELPDARRDRFLADYGLSRYDAHLLVADKAVAEYFEAAAKAGRADPKAVANWIGGELFRLMKETGQEIDGVKVTPPALAEMLGLIAAGTISGKVAKDVFAEMFATGKRAPAIVAEKGLTQISDAAALAQVVAQVIAANPQAVADFQSGKETALRFLVGQVMKATKGQANPALANELLLQQLASKAAD
jgi:aspartyl-tRNA(Asn)/glutamyl-tRNA(Gln) amidotransferase subunit B